MNWFVRYQFRLVFIKHSIYFNLYFSIDFHEKNQGFFHQIRFENWIVRFSLTMKSNMILHSETWICFATFLKDEHNNQWVNLNFHNKWWENLQNAGKQVKKLICSFVPWRLILYRLKRKAFFMKSESGSNFWIFYRISVESSTNVCFFRSKTVKTKQSGTLISLHVLW